MQKIMLFDGTNLDKWRYKDGSAAGWPIKDGAITTHKMDIVSTETFEDAIIHVEFCTPSMPDATGQAKGNSGVYLQGRYEIQVLDSYGINIPGTGDCGAIYDVYAPLVNACRPALNWQSYDIAFRAPRTGDAGNLIENARATILQNGTIIHNNVEIQAPTGGALDDRVGTPGPLRLQFHNDAVRYRNIWLVHLPKKGSDTYEPR